MATGNFYNVNAKHIYAILPQSEGDIYVYDFIEEGIREALNELIQSLKANEGIEIQNYERSYRNYPAKMIGSLGITKFICDIELYININILMRSGYYEGANLDYDYRFYVNGCECDNIVDACEEFVYRYTENRGMALIQARNAEKWFEKTFNEATDRIENILKEKCTHILDTYAVFSNGETLYSEVKL